MKPTAKAYLESVRRAVKREAELVNKVQVLQERAEGLGSMDYSAVRVTSSMDGSSLERRVMSLMNARVELEEHTVFTTALVEQAAGMLRKMVMAGCPESVADELELYYLVGMSTREVAQAVDRSVSRIKAHRAEALRVSDDFVPLDAG